MTDPERAERHLQDPSSSADSGDGVRILVVDDHVDTTESLRTLLQLKGNAVSVSNDGSSALKTVEDNEIDLVLLDISMPGMNGWDVARELRKKKNAERALIAAITGLTCKEDRQRSQQAGIDVHLVKPLSMEDYAHLLETARQRRKSSGKQ